MKGQEPNSSITNGEFNKKYLEHLIKIKIDSVRQVNSCKSLINDSILYIASSHHSDYMSKNNKLSHYEYENAQTKTPQLRAKYYGAKNYGVGENVLKTTYNSVVVSNDKKRTYNTFTYQELANSIVDGWVNSPGHFKNIITPEFQITGVTVCIDTIKNMLFACQKFANVLYKYTFVENKLMFPYSTYQLPKKIDSFDGIPHRLLIHNHKWGVTHNNQKLCNRCLDLEGKKPEITLSFEKNSFKLYIGNSEYVKKLIQNKKDGFAVEIVEFNDYMCGNPDYYTKPSRRNGQCKLNGVLVNPLYREGLYKGYKKKKRNKSLTYLSYLFSADSVPFFDRFVRYKIEKFDSEYFEINLGRLPKQTSGYWGYNLVYLHDKEICHLDYFTKYCGDLFFDSKPVDFIPFDTIVDYKLKVDTVRQSFIIPFLKNKFLFEESDIYPLLDSISNNDYTIQSIQIQAYSSIEGDSIINSKLQSNRAASLINVFQKNQLQDIMQEVKCYNSWKDFYHEIKRYAKWSYLASLDRDEILNKINNGYADSLEFILSKQRRGVVKLQATIDLSDNNLDYYIKKENRWLCDTLNKTPTNSDEYKYFINRYRHFYKFVYKKVIEDKVDTMMLAELSLPKGFTNDIKLIEMFILFGYQFPKAYSTNEIWITNRKQWDRLLIRNHKYELTDEYIYNHCRINLKNLQRKNYIDKDDVQALFDKLNLLRNFYDNSDITKKCIDNLYFNLNMLLINQCFPADPKENSISASISIQNILNYYKEYEIIDKEKALAIAKLCVFYNHVSQALFLLSPYMDDDEILSFAIPLMYQHYTDDYSGNYYNYLINLSNNMNTGNWCNLFLLNCKIPFQAFDHEELRDIFCEKCMYKNDFLRNEIFNEKR